MTNARILLMRHAEKTGDPMDPHLSQDGYARAAKLADFIPARSAFPSFSSRPRSPSTASDPLRRSNPFRRKSGFQSTQHMLIKTTAPWPINYYPNHAMRMRAH